MKASAILLIQVICVSRLLAQDADTIVLKNDNHKFSILSQIDNQAEIAAFRDILSAGPPHQRYQLAKNFVSAYPQSWLLPQAYEVLARSAVDLGIEQEALSYGRFSLRLIPENPSLLVLMANLEARKNEFTRALADAADAVEYLSQIERPPGMNESEWNSMRPKLKSSAYFARARAEASKGIGGHSEQLLRDALDDLNSAAAWNADDGEVFYLRAVVELQLQDREAAASDLAFVYRADANLQDKARRILLMLARKPSGQDEPLGSFVSRLPPPAVDAKLRNENRLAANSQVLMQGYAGPDACRSCHAKEYAAWQKTGMARMLRPYQSQNVVGDFSPSSQYLASIRMGIGVRPYFEINNSGHWDRYYVDFTIGSKWQQAYATKLPDGRMQVLPIEYNLLQKRWINYWDMIDPPGGSRANIQEFSKLTSATNYQQNCAICHTSQLKVDTAAAGSMEHATYLQPGIDCEMCHGPSARHVQQEQKGKASPEDTSERPLDFRKVSNREGVAVCAQCHRQSAVRELGAGGEMNYSTTGNFVPSSWLRPYDAFSRKAFYKDGRFRETTFIVEAFTRSACYLRGAAQCATCHSPHLGDFETNKTSLKFQSKPNEMCLGCHAAYRTRIAEHSHHPAASEASQCVSCHMPRIMNALLFKARSHQIEIPSADLTERFGQQDSPNVCLTCHSEKNVRWAQEQLAAWVN